MNLDLTPADRIFLMFAMCESPMEWILCELNTCEISTDPHTPLVTGVIAISR